MTDCGHYRRALLADPHDADADMRMHVASCVDCTEYTAQLLRFETRLDRALRVPAQVGAVRRGAAVVIPLRSVRRKRAVQSWRLRRGWLAAAASVLVGVMVAGSLWLVAPRPSLAADVVGHMAEEPQAWARTDIRVPQPKLDEVLSESHIRLKADPGMVSYANSCRFRGHQVPHLVVQTEAGPVTVMVLTHERSRGSTRFSEQGYQGVIVPIPEHGSLAVLQRGSSIDMNTVKSVAGRVLGAIDWRS